ncbi:MAG: copper chaperone PCu(A)C [Wenzhouxiangellaceae bacterium]
MAALAVVFLISLPTFASAVTWDRDYFPDVELVTDEGKTVHFFDDVIKDKIVAILFIYTTCPDSCPLETAQLVKVQEILGDRVGEDVFFYSITIDPEVDTPEVLAEYKKRFGARWTFLTGNEEDIIDIRRKLGLYIEEIQDGSNNHNVSMIIGNQATGRWMKRSPFENPHVLADQLGNWLSGWKAKGRGGDYETAPELRNISRGEQVFRTRCATCHTLDGKDPKDAIGPDLLGVTFLRDEEWLLNWLRAPDQMLANKDPIAMALYEQYDQLAMPNMRLNKFEAIAVLDFIEEVTREKVKLPAADTVSASEPEKAPVTAQFTVSHEEPAGDVVAIMNAWVREAHPSAPVNAGYMTLVNTGNEDLVLEKIESDAYEVVEVHEMAVENGMRKMRQVPELRIPARGQIALEPNGMHLMLKQPRQQLTAGEKVDMILTFGSGRTQAISIQVAAR